MTRIERLERKLDGLYSRRAAASRACDVMELSRLMGQIAEAEQELIEARQYAPKRLSEFLADKGEDVKNNIYKALLRISLAADFMNECAEEAKSIFAKLGLKEHTLTGDVKELCRLSQNVASFAAAAQNGVLTDMIVEDSEFIEKCANAADEHLEKKLGL